MDAVFLDFVNSRWDSDHGQGPDYLRDLRGLNFLRARWGMSLVAGLTAAESEQLVSLRATLTDALTALVSGTTPSAKTLAKLNDYLAVAVVRYELVPTETGCRPILQPASETEVLTSTVIRSFAQFISDHDPARLRFCANPECNWAFYDESRNATRRWCAPACSSLIKVRRFRERHSQVPKEREHE